MRSRAEQWRHGVLGRAGPASRGVSRARERGSRRCMAQGGHQAEARHSFDDAALCYNRALLILGDTGPMDASRARLLLELAAAQIRAGDLDAGRRNSSEAFRIGESLGDAGAARGCGADLRQHIHLWQCRSAAGRPAENRARAGRRGDTDRRARLQARLAAAMQPAADPSEPVALAHDAIRLARSAGDARTLLTTLRSAVSALMDFGDPLERLALNQEYVAPGAPARRRARMHARLHALGGGCHGVRRRGHAR